MAASIAPTPQTAPAPQETSPAPGPPNRLSQNFPGGFPGLGKSTFPGTAVGGFNSFQGLSAAMFQTANEIKKLPDELKRNDPSLNQVANSTVFSNEDVLRNSLHNSVTSKINLDQAAADGASRVICSNTDLIIATKNRVCLFSFDRFAGVFAYSKTIIGRPHSADSKAHSLGVYSDLVFIQMNESNDLIIFDKKEDAIVQQFKGEPSIGVNSDSEFMTIKQSSEQQDIFLWYSGGPHVTLIDIKKNFSPQKLQDFLKKDGGSSPLGLLYGLFMAKPNKVLALCISDADEFFLRIYDLEKQKVRPFALTNMTDEKKSKTIDCSLSSPSHRRGRRPRRQRQEEHLLHGLGEQARPEPERQGGQPDHRDKDRHERPRDPGLLLDREAPRDEVHHGHPQLRRTEQTRLRLRRRRAVHLGAQAHQVAHLRRVPQVQVAALRGDLRLRPALPGPLRGLPH